MRRTAAAWLLTLPALAQTANPSIRHHSTHHAVVATRRQVAAAAHAARHASGHVPVLVPRHAPPRHAAIVAAKQAVIRHDPPPPAPVESAAGAPPPAPPPATPADIGTNTGLHLPRYASLKSDDVNMRVGPAERYPVIWTYKRRDLPVRIEREFDIWRLVEDMDGVKGWVHQATLTGRRSFVVTASSDTTLRAAADDTSAAVAILKPGVIGRIRSCEAGKAWCEIQVQDMRGWLQRSSVWGVDAQEAVTP